MDADAEDAIVGGVVDVEVMWMTRRIEDTSETLFAARP